MISKCLNPSCKKVYKVTSEPSTIPGLDISHGFCPECAEKFEKMTFDEMEMALYGFAEVEQVNGWR